MVGAVWIASLQHSQGIQKRAGIRDLTFIIRTNKIEYAPAETVHVIANLTNTGEVAVTIILGGCAPAALFSDPYGTIWFDTASGKSCLNGIVEAPLEPGHSLVVSYEWDQRDYHGHPVPSSEAYQAQAGSRFVKASDGQLDGGLSGETWFFIRSASNGS